MTKRLEITDFSDKYMYVLLYFCKNLNMVNMKYFYHLLLCVALTFSACSEGEDNPSQLKLADGVPTEIVLGDGETNSVKEIKFVASAPWTASVKETSAARSGSEVDWLTLDKYSGEAGEFTLTLTIKDNETSETRKAEIVIVCGDTTITITVEQKPSAGGNEGGSETADSRLVKTIKIVMLNKPDEVAVGKFTYDDNGRVVKMVAGPEQGAANQTFTIEYNGNILVINETGVDSGDTYNSKYEVELNEAGDAVKMYKYDENGTKNLSYDFEYDNDGRLIQIQSYISNELSDVEKITYENGLLKSYEYDDLNEGEDSGSFKYIVDLETAYSHKYQNKGNIDPVSFILQFFGESYYVLYHINVLGKTSDLLPEDAMFVRESSNEKDKFSYEFDDNGRVVKMTIDESDWGGGDAVDRYIEFIY